MQFEADGCVRLSIFGPDWSPCSRWCPLLRSGPRGSLLLLNTRLETVACFGHDFEPSPIQLVGYTLAWTPDSNLTAHADPRFTGSAQGKGSRSLDICWHASESGPGQQAAAEAARVLLGGLCAGKTLQQLAWSPNNALAAVTGLPQRQLADGRFVEPSSDKQHKLYVLEPEQQLAIITLRFEQQGSVIWSPAGDRILMESGHALELVTNRCVSVRLLLQQYGASSACFSPDGRHCAVVQRLLRRQDLQGR